MRDHAEAQLFQKHPALIISSLKPAITLSGMVSGHHASLIEHFGAASVEQLQHLLGDGKSPSAASNVVKTDGGWRLEEVLPLGATSLLAAVLNYAQPAAARNGLQALSVSTSAQYSGSGLLLRGNVCSALKVMQWRGSTDGWTSDAAVAYGERLLQVPETAFRLVAPAGSKDYAALRYLAEAVRKNMSAEEVARALQEEEEGQQCLETFHTSPTFGAVVALASWWWDDVLDWLEGAVQWVKDAVSAFGEWASKQAKALVENVFSRYEGLVHVLEEIPGIGMAVAGIYALAGDTDHAWAAFAINLNECVTVGAAAIAFCLGGPAAAMAGGAIGKAAGLQIQIALSKFIHDPKLRADVGDISTTRYIIDVLLAGAAYGGASGVAKTLAKELGYGFVKTLGLSVSLSWLLSALPNTFTH